MKKHQTVSDQIWQFFCSVKLAVCTLAALAATSILGTVILQNGSERQYVALYGRSWTNMIKVFNLDDMYHAWWFLGLIILLCINIIVCSVERLTTTWKIIFPKKIRVQPKRFKNQGPVDPFIMEDEPGQLVPACRDFLSRKIGRVMVEPTRDGTALYAEKGRWTRVGVYVVHASILLLLIGALIGALFGFKANLRLEEGEISGVAFLAKERTPISLDFQLRCNEFEVKFYDTGAPEEFRTNLTIIENGEDSVTKDIRVNHPLRYKGINIFQASYGSAAPDAVHLDVVRQSDKKTVHHTVKMGQTVPLPDGKGSFKLERFIPHFDFRGRNLGEAFVLTVTPGQGKGFRVGLPVKFPSFDRMRKGNFAFVVKTFDQKYYTGLQVTKDPGVWYVYAGFILMIIGCWITFFMSHQSYYIEITPESRGRSRVFLSGTTNRNTQGLKLKLQKIATQLKDL